jgi:hypothetical protein
MSGTLPKLTPWQVQEMNSFADNIFRGLEIAEEVRRSQAAPERRDVNEQPVASQPPKLTR